MATLTQQIAERLKARRLYLDYTQAEVGDAVGIGRGGYQGWEAGRVDIAASDLAKLASFLKVSVSYFFDEDPGEIESEQQAERLAQSVHGFFRGVPPKISQRAMRRLAELAEQDDPEAGSTIGKKA